MEKHRVNKWFVFESTAKTYTWALVKPEFLWWKCEATFLITELIKQQYKLIKIFSAYAILKCDRVYKLHTKNMLFQYNVLKIFSLQKNDA